MDPVEKKPFFHVCPGSGALSFGMLGCNLHCAFCQNWHSSQSLRDPGASVRAQPVSAGQVVQAALRRGCRSLISTYNEPLISAEWAHEIFSEAKRHGLLTGVVSNGQATEEVLAYLGPQTDLFKVDL
ncbi:MAG: radical SAM protein, partial [Delftia sp.]|nr:radical SAM protein [Delftia sp.]